ncbi:hypothetical protein [Hoeflea sp. TYP-13]|uniref:hypothetical protein n=1 Tax=Hoeflea sp. TYP-13 TaxID=3230023 RepID=UPI0034C60535
MRKLPKTAIAAIFALCPAAPAQAAEILETLDGKWSGSGWARHKPGAERETVRCRISGIYRQTDRRLTLKGKCASPGRSGRLDGYVEPVDKADTYAGRWSNPFGAGSTMVHGRNRGDAITFRFKFRDRETDETVNGIMVWTVRADRFTIATGDVSGGKAAILSEIEFQR